MVYNLIHCARLKIVFFQMSVITHPYLTTEHGVIPDRVSVAPSDV